MKKRRGLKVFLCILAILALFIATVNVIPPKKVTDVNPFLKGSGELPMIAAHRGGGISNPENTLMAYRAAVNEYGIQICETDVWMTRDGHLVYSHDSSINRMACEEGADRVLIAEHTLAELREYNMGYNFADPVTGEFIYRDKTGEEQERLGLKILEFDELMSEFYDNHKELLFIVEIKNGDEAGFRAADIIDETLTERFPDYKNSIVIGTFHPEIEKYLKNEHPTLMRGGSTAGAGKFIVTQMFGVNLFANVDFTCLQIPMSFNVKGLKLNLTKKSYIRRAHRMNMAVQFWTINDPDDMRFLTERDVDAIMTDDPKLLKEILKEYKK